MPLVECDVTRGRARNESGKIGRPLKKYQLNTTDVAPITRDTSYFASVTRRNDSCSLSCANTAKSITDSSRSCACFMKTFLAENYFGVRKEEGGGEKRRGRDEKESEREKCSRRRYQSWPNLNIQILRREDGPIQGNTEKVQAREGNEDAIEKDREREKERK